MFSSTVTHPCPPAYADPASRPVSRQEQIEQIEVANIASYLRAGPDGPVMRAPLTRTERSEAWATIMTRFGTAYIQRTTEVDLDDALDDYTRCGANARVTFLDYFTLRDYKEAGYTRVNPPMIQCRPTAESEQLRTRLTQALHNLVYTALPQDRPIDVLYRGTRLPRSTMQEMSRHAHYTPPAFFSLSSDKETAEGFLLAPQECAPTEVNVMFEVTPHPCSRAANLSAILRDGECEYLFGPHAAFQITAIDADPTGSHVRPVVIQMQELGSE